MNSPEQVNQIPVGKTNDQSVYLRDVADWKTGNTIGEYDRINQQRFITLTANIYKKDLGSAIKDINSTIKKLGEQPQGVKVYLRGQSEMLDQTINELSTGLILAIVVIGLMLTAYFQSIRLSLSVLSVLPGVLAGSMFLIWITGNTINIQSFMGSIMAVGVAVSNSILIVVSAETIRKHQKNIDFLGTQAVLSRFRPILMTSTAMIVGMIPMSLGLGESGQQTAPLGIAVIGGLLFSTIISLWIVPLTYEQLRNKKDQQSTSLDPNDKNSAYYDNTI
jgi:multidrug efflux pump subunit AcrB